jgi:hypothetical protein
VRSLFPQDEIKSPALIGYLNTFVEMGIIEHAAYDTYVWVPRMEERIFAKTVYAQRRKRHSEIKEKVAHACLIHTRPNGEPLLADKFCLICQGSSTEPLFKEIKSAKPSERPQSVVTNSIPGFLILLDSSDVDLAIIGGKIELKCGAIRPTPSSAANFDVNVVVLSCSSVDPDGHIWCGDEMEEMRSEILKPNVDVPRQPTPRQRLLPPNEMVGGCLTNTSVSFRAFIIA